MTAFDGTPVRWLSTQPNYVRQVDGPLTFDRLQGGPGIEPHAPGALVERLRAFIRLDAGATGR